MLQSRKGFSLIMRRLKREEINRLRELDRSEYVRLLYKYSEGSLVSQKADLDVPRWSEQECVRRISKLLQELAKGGIAVGAFDDDLLVGLAVLGHKLIGDNLDELQLVSLHVSRDYRRKGIAVELLGRVCKLARDKGAKRLYISATPSESAVGFYLNQRSKLATKVNKELYQLEPEDIHMVKDL